MILQYDIYMMAPQKSAEERKQQIQAADLSRKNNKALTELEQEARKRSQSLLEQSNALRMEQEEEIKRLNKVGIGWEYVDEENKGGVNSHTYKCFCFCHSLSLF